MWSLNDLWIRYVCLFQRCAHFYRLQPTAWSSRNAYRIKEWESVLLRIVLKGQGEGQVKVDARSRLLVVYAFQVNTNVQSDNDASLGFFLLSLESHKTGNIKHSVFHEVCAINVPCLFLPIPLLWHISIWLSVIFVISLNNRRSGAPMDRGIQTWNQDGQ